MTRLSCSAQIKPQVLRHALRWIAFAGSGLIKRCRMPLANTMLGWKKQKPGFAGER